MDMKSIIILSIVLMSFGCASGGKSYCDIVDREVQVSKQMIEDDRKADQKTK